MNEAFNTSNTDHSCQLNVMIYWAVYNVLPLSIC